jgi:hypothetical protein
VRDFLFIHIPKTGGVSIRKVLEPYSYVGVDGEHTPIKAGKFVPYVEKYFSFCFVRNPWDRFVSSYFYLNRGGANTKPDKKAYEMYIKPYKTFKDVVMNIDEDKGNLFFCQHFVPQMNYIIDDHDDVIVDFIGRFEKINEDFAEVCKKIGIPPIELPLLNASSHQPYWEYYDDESQEMIFRKYNREIDYFKYQYEPHIES